MPGLASPTKFRLRRLNDDRIADFLVGGRSAALVLSRGEWPQTGWRLWRCRMPTRCIWATPTRTASARSWSVPASGRSRSRRRDDCFTPEPLVPEVLSPSADLWLVDINGDGRNDLVTSSWRVFPRREDGSYPGDPGLSLSPFPAAPSSRIDLGRKTADRHPLLRDTPAVADWDGDGVDDLIVGQGQDRRILVLQGGREGQRQTRSLTIPLDYRLH